MILIADAGSTKTHWCLMTYSGQRSLIETAGINPITQTEAMIDQTIQQLQNQIGQYLWIGAISHIFFYGAGCTETAGGIVANLLQKRFSTNTIVQSDMIGAAKALWQDRAGITCILGTGSNSCKYAEGRIIQQTPSLGYILGDEGSASHIGRTLVNRIFKKQLPDDICRRFLQKYDLTLDRVIENVYKKPNANTFLAQFAIFCQENLDDSPIRDLVKSCFASFIRLNVLPYRQDDEEVKIGFVGSIAYHFQDLIEEVCQAFNLQIGKVIQAPIDDLCDYHKKDLFPTM